MQSPHLTSNVPSTGGAPRRARGRRAGVTAGLALAGLALAACGSSGNAFSSSSATAGASAGASASGGSGGSGSGGGGKALTVGGANFTEMLVVQQLYGQVLAKNGYTVSYKAVDNREVYEPALEQGQIDVVPEYAATMANYMSKRVNGASAKDVATSDATSTVSAMQPLLQQKGLKALTPSAATDRNAFAVTKKFAQDNNLKTLSDLAKLNKPLRLAAPTECPDRPFCKIGLEKTYGLNISQVLPLGFGSPQAKQAVVSGRADMVETGTTDATLDALGLVVLADDKNLQLADNIVPVVNASRAGTPAVTSVLDKVSQTLTTDDLAQLNLKVDAQRLKPEDVAKEYLQSKGL